MAARGGALAREEAAVRAEIAYLELRRAALEAEVALRYTDAYIERKARELGYVRPGEGLATLRERPRAAGFGGSDEVSSRIARWIAVFFSDPPRAP